MERGETSMALTLYLGASARLRIFPRAPDDDLKMENQAASPVDGSRDYPSATCQPSFPSSSLSLFSGKCKVVPAASGD